MNGLAVMTPRRTDSEVDNLFHEVRSVQTRMDAMNTAMDRTNQQLDRISQALVELVRLEERSKSDREKLDAHTREIETLRSSLTAVSLKTPDDLTKRLANIENEMPQIKEKGAWFIAAVIAALSGAAMLCLKYLGVSS